MIGKYGELKADKVVAISSSRFSRAARLKAERNRIEAITVNEALTKDWKTAIEGWRGMTHSFTLMRIATFKGDGQMFTLSEVTPDGSKATHQDEESEFMYNVLKPFFMSNLSQSISRALEAKIEKRWQSFFSDPTPRWAEVTIENPGLTKYGTPIDVARIVFGIGTFFHKVRRVATSRFRSILFQRSTSRQ